MKSIILSGGRGTRLWPLSRTYYPKQYIKMDENGLSLFQKTFKRSLALADGDASDIFIVSNEKQKFLIYGQIEEMDIPFPESNVLIEPDAKNTLPAICYGVSEIIKAEHNSGIKKPIAVFPSDHIIGNETVFLQTVKDSECLTDRFIATFGILPDRPHTGYGYICPGKETEMKKGYIVTDFKEKPTYETAQSYIKSGFLWNSGMFLFKTDVFVREMNKHSPEIARLFFESNTSNEPDTIAEKYAQIDPTSIDYGLMEKTDASAVIPLDAGWNDMGSFDSFFEEYKEKTDENGNISICGTAVFKNSENNLIYTSKNKLTTAIGVEDLIIIDTDDALLITKKEMSQSVKDIVNYLKNQEDERIDFHTYVYRPWGSYRILNESDTYKIKEILVLPGKKLSYQLHNHRTEHWSVVEGKARVTLNGKKFDINSGESTYIPIRAKHRLENPETTVLKIIESQIGEKCNEDDIVRFEDDWNRT